MNDFQEAFKHYQNGTATKAERCWVEEELTNYQLIERYLIDNDDQDLLLSLDFTQPPTLDVKKMRKRATRKILWFALIPALLITSALIGMFGWTVYVRPAAEASENNSYFNPNKGLVTQTDDTGKGQAMLDFTVYTSLFLPVKMVDQVNSPNTGVGDYQLTVDFRDHFSPSSTSTFYEGHITKNKLIPTSNTNQVLKAPGNLFYRGYSFHAYQDNSATDKNDYTIEGNIENDQLVKQELALLPKSSWVSTYFSFKEDLPLETLFKTVKQEGLQLSWVAVRNPEPHQMQQQIIPTQIGFACQPSLTVYTDDSPLPEKDYPLLLNQLNLESATDYETHFRSQLKYLLNRQDFMTTLQSDHSAVSYDELSQANDYIQKNGLKSYGVLVYGPLPVILDALNAPLINGFTIDNAKLSHFTQ